MSAPVAIESREKLRSQLGKTRVYQEEQRQLVNSLRKDLKEAQRAKDTALTAFIRQQDEKTSIASDKAHAECERLATELARADAHAEAAAVARKEVENEIGELHAEHFDVFAQEAEEATQRAHAEILALGEPYFAAMRAWQAAVTTWGPLAPAIRDRLIDHESATGLFPDPRYRNDASRVANFPLPNPAQVFGAVAQGTLTARPRALQPDAVEDEVIEESMAGTG